MFNIDDCMAFIITESSKQFSETFQKSLKEFNISRSQWLALYYIFNNEGLTQIRLANLMSLKGPTIVKMLQTLEADGYIRRTVSETDKREKGIVLLEKGKAKMRTTLPFVEEFKNRITEGLSEEELETTKKVLAVMTKNSEKI